MGQNILTKNQSAVTALSSVVQFIHYKEKCEREGLFNISFSMQKNGRLVQYGLTMAFADRLLTDFIRKQKINVLYFRPLNLMPVSSPIRIASHKFLQNDEWRVNKLHNMQRAFIITQFALLFEGLKRNHERLQSSYSADPVIKTSRALLKQLKLSFESYKRDKNQDLNLFKTACFRAIDIAKKDFNTHRGSLFTQFLSKLISYIRNLFTPEEEKNQRVRFFGSSLMKPTTAANVLYEFQLAVEGFNKSTKEYEDVLSFI